MAKTTLDGYYTATTPDNAIHSKAGILRGFLINATSNSAVCTVTFYDNTTATGTVLLTVDVHGTSPFYVMFPRDFAIRFTTGLSLTLSNATAVIWSEDWGI